ncbi:MAG: hypothetical protein K5765_08625 [Clostridia bacterium]|nr:hypothetical protein [Clostridia bacterium]
MNDMLKTFDLVKIFLKDVYSKSFKNKRSKNKSGIILILFLVVIYFFIFIFNFKEIFELTIEAGGTSFDALAQVIFMITMMSIVFSILSGTRLTLTDKDVAILTPLPIKRRKIVSAKLITAIIIESAFDVILGVSAIVAMIIVGGFSYIDFLSIFFVLSLSTILPMTLFSFFMMWISKLVSKSKHKNIFEMITTALMFALIMIPSFFIGFSTGSSGTFTISGAGKILSYIPFVFLIKIAIVNQNILYVLLYVLVNALLFIGFVLLFNKVAYNLMVREKSNFVSRKVSKVPYKIVPVNKRLYKNELKKFVAKPVYFANFLMSPILFLIIGLVPIFLKGTEYMNNLIGEEGLGMNIYPLILAIVTLFISLFSFLPTVSFSLDKKIMWLFKTYPIKMKTIIFSKILAPVSMILALDLIVIIPYSIFGGLSVVDILLDVLFAIATAFIYTIFYLFLGLRHPNQSDDEAQVVRQSVSTVIAAILSMFLIFANVFMIIMFSIMMGVDLAILSTLGVNLLFGLIWVLLLKKNSEKYLLKFY